MARIPDGLKKLKKRTTVDDSSPTISRTMAMAQYQVAQRPQIPVERVVTSSSITASVDIQPQTAMEQYWAARALKAETLLAAQEKHQKEVKLAVQDHEAKRQAELAALSREHREKHTALEKLLIFLLIFIALLVLVIIYLTTHYTRHAFLHQKQQQTWWSAIGASHFTIPILSPFTSVVEHENSTIGVRTIGTLAVVAACLVYFIFRHWFSSTQREPFSARPISHPRAIDQ